MRSIKRVGARLVLFALATFPIGVRADTVASLLGNFTINQFCGLKVGEDAVNLRYTVVFGQLPALRELHAADADGDGVTTQVERDAYVERLAPAFADELKLSVDGARIPLKVIRWTTSLPTEQGGFSLRLDIDFFGAIAANAVQGDHVLAFSNTSYAGRFGWQEIVVETSPSVKVFATDAFNTSLTAGLTESLAAMPATGPLNERAVNLSFTRGAVPAGARLLQPRPGTVPTASQDGREPRGDASGAWLQRETRRVIDLISAPNVAPHIALLALLAAALLGALHAFSPGHGKTVVGAYLIGSRATARHAAFLGATVTVTHTVGVFVLGFATLFASQFIVPERLFPILSLLSGLIVLGMGLILLVQRWSAAREVFRNRSTRRKGKKETQIAAPPLFRPVTAALASGPTARSFFFAPAHGHDHFPHDHDHSHDHDHTHQHQQDGGHAHDASGMHSHGGRMHSHVPPGASGEAVTWRSLLALGISGGLVPCPSAMVLLLAAIALNKTAFGMLLVVAFSIGLALTLMAIGLIFLYARNRIQRPTAGASWPKLLPVLSAGAVTIIGALLCYGALTGSQF